MQERHHVKTIPGEQVAPEVVSHPVRREEGGNVQMDDINIPLVAIVVAFFASFLVVSILFLQAWVYNDQAAEKIARTLPQYDVHTELGRVYAAQEEDLNGPAGAARPLVLPAAGAGAATSTAPASQAVPARLHVPIDDAMRIVAREGGV